MPLFYRAWAISLVLLVQSGAAAAQSEAERLREGFLQLAANADVAPAALRLTYEPAGEGAGRAVAAFDPASGAWYWATQLDYKLRTQSGKVVVGSAVGEPQEVPEQWASVVSVAQYFPHAYLRYLSESPSSLLGVRETDAGYVVRFRLPASPENMPDMLLEVDEWGTPRRVWRDDPNDERMTRLVYAEDGPAAGYAVASFGARSQHKLVESVALPRDSLRDVFDPQSLQELVRENDRHVQRELSRIVSERSTEGGGGSGAVAPARSAPTPRRFADRYRWPLLGGGLIIIAIALFEIWRRRG